MGSVGALVGTSETVDFGGFADVDFTNPTPLWMDDHPTAAVFTTKAA